MRNLSITYLLLLLLTNVVKAQDFIWAREMPSLFRTLAIGLQGETLIESGYDHNYDAPRELRCLSAAGETLWTRVFPADIKLRRPIQSDGAGGYFVPVEGSGTVVIDGVTHTFTSMPSLALVKINAQGQCEWIKYDSPLGDLYDYGFDDQGNFYSSGWSVLRKHDPAGNLLWAIPHPWTDTGCFPGGVMNSLEVMDDGHIVVAGTLEHCQNEQVHFADTTFSPTNLATLLLACFDAEGQRKWLHTGSGYYVVPGNLAKDTAGHVYYGFNPYGLDWENLTILAVGTENGAALFKYNATTGQQVWAKTYPAWSWLEHLEATPDGTLFLCGQLRNIEDTSSVLSVNGIEHVRDGFYQGYVARFDTDGVPQWLALTYESQYPGFDYLQADLNGNIWVSGFNAGHTVDPTRYGDELILTHPDFPGVVALLRDTLAPKPMVTSRISGFVFEDMSGDCTPGTAEPSIKGMSILAEPGPFYAKTDENGRYALDLPPGNYTLMPIARNDHSLRMTATCTSMHTMTLVAGSPDSTGFDFPFMVERCGLLAAYFEGNHGLDVTNPGDTIMTLKTVYHNFGSEPLSALQFVFDFPSVFYPLDATPVPWTTFNTSDSSLFFELPTIAPGETDTLVVRLALTCNQFPDCLNFNNFQFPLSAHFINTGSCYPEDSVLTQYAWKFGLFIPVNTQSPNPLLNCTVWPNPAPDGLFHVQFSSEQPVVWRVTDALGRTVLQEKYNKDVFQLDLRSHPPGIYFLHGQTKNGMIRQKIVRQ